MIENHQMGKLIKVTLIALGLIGLVIFFGTAPLKDLFGESQHAFSSAIHGLFSGLFLVTVTVGLFQAYRLYVGVSIPAQELQFGSMMNALFAFATILYGNMIYIPYRATSGPRTYFLEHMPEIHEIFFEFKEFIALFTFPLAVSIAFLFIYYRETLLERKELRILSATAILLLFFYFTLTFGLGAAITKLKAV